MSRVHGTAVGLPDGDAWRSVLLRGPSGAGKSDLALRLIEAGARLIADDQVELNLRDGQVNASPPDTLAGRLEVRGLGIMEMAFMADVPLGLVCDLTVPDDVPRMPEPAYERLLDVDLPLVRIAPFEPSAPIKVRLGLEAAWHGIVA